MSRKIMDMSIEKELGLFLDCYFYPWLIRDFNMFPKRVYDSYLQFKGVDMTLYNNHKEYYLDEKAQLYYINKNLPTFAFEIDFINRNNQLAQGWLFNQELITNYYLLIWPYARTTKLSKIKVNDFTKVECLIVDRNKIINYLQFRGWDYNRIFNKAREIRRDNIVGKVSIPQENTFYFYFSNFAKYSEKPINIVIRKIVLVELAEAGYVVSRNGITRIK